MVFVVLVHEIPGWQEKTAPFEGQNLTILAPVSGEIEPYGGSVMSDRRQILERLQLVAEEAQLGELEACDRKRWTEIYWWMVITMVNLC